jgi:hypothetical protein
VRPTGIAWSSGGADAPVPNDPAQAPGLWRGRSDSGMVSCYWYGAAPTELVSGREAGLGPGARRYEAREDDQLSGW